MLTLSKLAPSFISTQLEVKKSKFISYLFTSQLLSKELIKSHIALLKTQHPKARHFVYASRYLNDNLQIVESFSDDGEPKNTSGLPTLNVLRGLDLVQVGVITIRYFGGTKLGVGGLIRAYGSSCKEVLSEAKKLDLLLAYEYQHKCSIDIKYKDLSLVEYELKQHSLNIINKDFSENICITIEGNMGNIRLFKKFLKDNL